VGVFFRRDESLLGHESPALASRWLARVMRCPSPWWPGRTRTLSFPPSPALLSAGFPGAGDGPPPIPSDRCRSGWNRSRPPAWMPSKLAGLDPHVRNDDETRDAGAKNPPARGFGWRVLNLRSSAMGLETWWCPRRHHPPCPAGCRLSWLGIPLDRTPPGIRCVPAVQRAATRSQRAPGAGTRESRGRGCANFPRCATLTARSVQAGGPASVRRVRRRERFLRANRIRPLRPADPRNAACLGGTGPGRPTEAVLVGRCNFEPTGAVCCRFPPGSGAGWWWCLDGVDRDERIGSGPALDFLVARESRPVPAGARWRCSET